MVNEFPQVVTIAGSDSDGSAGMQADLHAFFTHQVYGASILTAAVAGNSYGIHAAINLPTDFIDQEFATLAADYHIRAAKTGMLADSTLIRTVVKNLKKYDFGALVVDPVIYTKHGDMLLEEAAFATLRNELVPLATVITPNFFEAQKLVEMQIVTEADTIAAAHKLQDLGAKNVVIKGDHPVGKTDDVRDFILLENQQSFWLADEYVATQRVNGTGDTLSAVITAELAKHTPIAEAIRRAHDYVHLAIEQEIAVAHKYGPINHWAK